MEGVTYTVSELSAQARHLFGVAPEAAAAALKASGTVKAGVEEARKIILAFLDREVR